MIELRPHVVNGVAFDLLQIWWIEGGQAQKIGFVGTEVHAIPQLNVAGVPASVKAQIKEKLTGEYLSDLPVHDASLIEIEDDDDDDDD